MKKFVLSLCIAAIALGGCRNRQNGTATVQSTGTHAGHVWVDLGLSVKWAACNVGADSPEQYGDYFAWGETERKDSYDWYNLKYCHVFSSLNFTKYITKTETEMTPEDSAWLADEEVYFDLIPVAGDSAVPVLPALPTRKNGYTIVNFSVTENAYEIDGRTVLEPSDDAARASWGGSWRMPTVDDWNELLRNCSWNWTTVNGISGHMGTSRLNGNTIFLPAAGYRDGTELREEGRYGIFWSSQLDSLMPWKAWGIYSYHKAVGPATDGRQYGRSVRAVCVP